MKIYKSVKASKDISTIDGSWTSEYTTALHRTEKSISDLYDMLAVLKGSNTYSVLERLGTPEDIQSTIDGLLEVSSELDSLTHKLWELVP